MQWLRDNLKMIKAAPEVEELAQTVEDNGGCYIVPAFSGLFAPYWKSNARGVVAGLTRYVNAGHIARATLEATAYQSREVVEAMNTDSGVALESLKVDGGMVGNDLLMQFQADLLGVPVIRPKVAETTSLGAAYAAGLATGFWTEIEDLRENWVEDKRWEPRWTPTKRDEYYKYWKKAVTRTFDWFEAEERLTAARPGAAPAPRVTGAGLARLPHGARSQTDVLVIGGGATGAGVAWDAALRGFDVVLVDRARPRRGHERPLPRPAALGRALRGQGPASRPRSASRRTRSSGACVPDCIEDTGGLFVTTPDDDPAYGDRFLEGCRAGRPARRGDRRRARRCGRSRG